MNKKNGIIIGVVGLIVLIISIFFVTNAIEDYKGEKKDKEQVTEIAIVTPEVLDDNVILPDDILSWVDENKSKKGFYTKVTENETFVLISGGKQASTGYGISLNDVKQTNSDVIVQYEVLAPMEGFEVKTENTTPSMLLRFGSTELNVQGEDTPLEDIKVDSKEDTKEDDSKKTEK